MSDLDDFFVFGDRKESATPPSPTVVLQPPALIKPARALYDAECREAIGLSRNMLVPWFLMAQYLYYYRDDPILTDGCFDQVSRRMTAEWDLIEHFHKPAAAIYVEQGKPQLQEHEYPLRARAAACRLAGIMLLHDVAAPKIRSSVRIDAGPPPIFAVQQEVVVRADIPMTGIKKGQAGRVIYVQYGQADTDRSTDLARTAYHVRFKGGAEIWMTAEELTTARGYTEEGAS